LLFSLLRIVAFSSATYLAHREWRRIVIQYH
jgi:hypothetical protein